MDACFIPVGYICITIGNLGSKIKLIKFKSTVTARYSRCLRLTKRSVLLCERPIIFRKLPLPQIDTQEWNYNLEKRRSASSTSTVAAASKIGSFEKNKYGHQWSRS